MSVKQSNLDAFRGPRFQDRHPSRSPCNAAVAQTRSTNLGGMPLSSIALLHGAPDSDGGHPIVFTGSYDNKVHSFSESVDVNMGISQIHHLMMLK